MGKNGVGWNGLERSGQIGKDGGLRVGWYGPMGWGGVEWNGIGWNGTGSAGIRWNGRLGMDGRDGMGWNG